MGVPIPPILAANGIQRTSAFLNGSPESTCARSGTVSVIIMAVVAVLLIHIEKIAVIAISPSITVLGFEPNIFSTLLASARSIPTFTAA